MRPDGDGRIHHGDHDARVHQVGPGTVSQTIMTTELAEAYALVAKLASELCGAVDAEAEDVGTGARSSLVILRELGPATSEVERIKANKPKLTYGLPEGARAELEASLKAAAQRKMTPAELREQRISWAYGNQPAGSKVTREQVQQLHDELYGKHG